MFTYLRLLACLILIMFSQQQLFSQQPRAGNLIVVVLDGMRWQEVFMGADSALVNNTLYTSDKKNTLEKFWDNDPAIRRKKLLPFLWTTVSTQGQLYGNRLLKNFVNVSNPYQLTYPGFSEMLTGYADPAIKSNKEIVSQSDNVLEFINKQKNFEGKVAVFATSELFPYLLNKNKSKLYINADTDTFGFKDPNFKLLNQMQRLSNKPTTERPDLLTYFAASEYLKKYQPRILYLALGETDAFAHAGNYDQYLATMYAEDKMIEELWEFIQTSPQYKNKTTMILTCDHGRGDAIKDEWRKHGPGVKDSGQIWLAAIGPSINGIGEIKNEGQLYQAQLAATMASVLGLDFKPSTHSAFPPIASLQASSPKPYD